MSCLLSLNQPAIVGWFVEERQDKTLPGIWTYLSPLPLPSLNHLEWESSSERKGKNLRRLTCEFASWRSALYGACLGKQVQLLLQLPSPYSFSSASLKGPSSWLWAICFHLLSGGPFKCCRRGGEGQLLITTVGGGAFPHWPAGQYQRGAPKNQGIPLLGIGIPNAQHGSFGSGQYTVLYFP